MKTTSQLLNEAAINAVIARKRASQLSNYILSKEFGVSVSTVANRIASLKDKIDMYSIEFNECIDDPRFLLEELDPDIALVVIDRIDNKSKTNLSMIHISVEAIEAQFTRDWQSRQSSYKEDLETAKDFGLKK